MNLTEEEEYIYCLSCGEKMKKDSRYCMRCGALNYDHPENSGMRPILDKTNKERRNMFKSGSLDKQKFILLAVNIGIVALLTVGIYLLFFNMKMTMTVLIGSLITCFYLYVYELILIKCRIPGWKAMIPFENIYQYFEISMNNGLLGITFFIPGINIIFLLISNYKLGKRFRYNGILTMLLPGIFIPVLALSSRYPERVYYDDNGKSEVEIKYRRKKIFYTIGIIIFMVVFTLIFKDTIKEGYEMTKEFFTKLWNDNYAPIFNKS